MVVPKPSTLHKWLDSNDASLSVLGTSGVSTRQKPRLLLLKCYHLFLQVTEHAQKWHKASPTFVKTNYNLLKMMHSMSKQYFTKTGDLGMQFAVVLLLK